MGSVRGCLVCGGVTLQTEWGEGYVFHTCISCGSAVAAKVEHCSPMYGRRPERGQQEEQTTVQPSRPTQG